MNYAIVIRKGNKIKEEIIISKYSFIVLKQIIEKKILRKVLMSRHLGK